MHVWDVLGKRTDADEFRVVGGVKAPDAEMALLLARETHFRHKEGVAYAVRRRGDEDLHVGPYDPEELGGVTDHSYRRQEAYAGVGAKLKRLSAKLAERGLVVEAPRPSARKARDAVAEHDAIEARDREAEGGAEAKRGGGSPLEQLAPEDVAAHGTAG